MQNPDVLIIGSGIAGLSVAIKVAQQYPDRQCVIITKQESAESNTRYAQGGIAVVSDFVQDSFDAHVADTLSAGDGLCNPAVVEHVVRQAPIRLQELIEMGADFDRDTSGQLILGREGGHKANRIIHARDVTGLHISTALLERVKILPNVTVLSHHVAVDLITANSSDGSTICGGARVLNQKTGEIEHYRSLTTVLATGGIGQLYATTTNPLIATGDGIAMAYRAGAHVTNMEFIQFHPTALYDPGSNPAFLISEAVRGQGAYLRNNAGERFVFRYHIDGELACRDVVARAIASEIQVTHQPSVYLDCTHISKEILSRHFPNILQTCLSKGIDITTAHIPVAPAAHYLCGGIDVDLRSRTSIHNLYACGECSNTGLHGANRLASNSLLEAIVFAHNCFEDIGVRLRDSSAGHRRLQNGNNFSPTNDNLVAIDEQKSQLKTLMNRYAGIVRTNKGLHYAAEQLASFGQVIGEDDPYKSHSPAWYEFRNMVTCARLIVSHSLRQKENRGGFYNQDLERTEVFN